MYTYYTTDMTVMSCVLQFLAPRFVLNNYFFFNFILFIHLCDFNRNEEIDISVPLARDESIREPCEHLQ